VLIRRPLAHERSSFPRTSILGKEDQFQVKSGKAVYFGCKTLAVVVTVREQACAECQVCSPGVLSAVSREESDQGASSHEGRSSKLDLEGAKSAPLLVRLRKC
jgi:hypothetical protein